MASSLSDDEFNRLQEQLLELRTQNYQVGDENKRLTRDIQTFIEKIESLEKSLEKANKTISKSKKAREVDLLIQDNGTLQRKLISQEEDFRLQNTTLMQELTVLVSQNEDLENKVKALKSGGAEVPLENRGSRELQDDIRRLQAENAVLQKNITVHQEKYETELTRLKDTIRVLQEVNTDLETQCSKLAGQRGTPAGDENAECRTVEGQDDPDVSLEKEDKDLPEDEVGNSSRLRNASFTELVNLVRKSESTSEDLQQQLKQVNDLRLKLDMEMEEKKMLKNQLNTLERNTNDQINSLQADVEKLTEKLKKKQESYVHLQEEKEKLYKDTSEKFDDLQTAKDREISQLMEQNTRMQAEIITANQAMDDYKDKMSRRIKELETEVSSLTDEVDAASTENIQQLMEQNDRLQQQIEEMDECVARSTQEHDDTKLQLKECQHASSITLEQLHAAQKERDKEIQALQEKTKLAEKRKSLLDELAIKYQKECDDHREAVKEMECAHKTALEELQSLLEAERAQTLDYTKMKAGYNDLQAQVQSLEEAKGWLERRLKEAEGNLEDLRTQYGVEKDDLKAAHQDELTKQKEMLEVQINGLEKTTNQLNDELQAKEDVITGLEQEIKDSVDQKKLHEKKGASLLKDLKRQLHAERKRAEKLQERLQELLSDTKSRQSVEELFKPIDPNDRYRGDNSSISSWSALGFGKENTSSLHSPQSQGSPSRTPPSVLEQENNDLLQRIGELQQEKWMLEEKVSHLEASTSAMADDLLRKTAIIDHYAMDCRIDVHPQSPSSDKLTFKRVMDFMKDKGDDNTRELNRKLQRVLEETLTKNMHLQKDLETLSEEVVRLSKVQATSTPLSSPAK